MQKDFYFDGDLVVAIVYCRRQHMLSTGGRFRRAELFRGPLSKTPPGVQVGRSASVFNA
jgi:hypothetical protein